MKTSELFWQIEELVPTLDGWCIPEKACDFAAIILSLRPLVSVEVGVWGGRGSLSMAMAHRFIGRGKVVAIDPWSAPASIIGQGSADAAWWGDQQKHDIVYGRFIANIESLRLQTCIEVRKERSDSVDVPTGIGLCVLDGNHSDQAIADVQRFAPNVVVGGIVYLDDLNWSTGSVGRAADKLLKMGFVRIFDRDEGAFFQRVK